MNNKTNETWLQYEAGKDYKSRIGLYERVRRNERFYQGDQWKGTASELPHPVFNLIRRITDYLVGTVIPGDLTIHYTDDALPFIENTPLRKKVTEGIALLTKNASYRWKQNRMEVLAHRALLDAAITGDGIFYCRWDPSAETGQPFLGDIRTELVDNTNLFVADFTKADIQSQDYLILSGRASVEALRNEAREAGVPEEQIQKILPDRDTAFQAGDMATMEPDSAGKTTCLIKFYRESGEVIFEKSTRNCLIRKVHTGLKFYPVAYFSWNTVKNSFHGNAPVSDMIPNQRYINTAYAMAMKHMSDTAFSKVIYDKSRIPEWSNEVGEAIAAVGGGNLSDAVTVVGVGQMQENYLELIDSVIDQTKHMMSATDSALGDAPPTNTSAILALQSASRIALAHVCTNLCCCVGDLAAIWADMLCTYCPPERLLPVCEEDGTVKTGQVDFALLKTELLRASAEAGNVSRYTPALTVTLLDRLLEGGYISVRQYLEHLPAGCVSDREALIRTVDLKGGYANE